MTVLLDIVIKLPVDLYPSVMIPTLIGIGLLAMVMAMKSSFRDLIYKIAKPLWTKVFVGLYNIIILYLTAPITVARTEKVMHIVQKDVNQMKAGANSSFKMTPEVRFRCNDEGENYLTTDLYRSLVGVMDDEKLAGTQWLVNLHIDDKVDYIKWSKETISNQREDTFLGVRFQDNNKNNIGTYKISLYPITYTNGREYVYFEGVIEPMDLEACDAINAAGERIGVRGVSCICATCKPATLPVIWR